MGIARQIVKVGSPSNSTLRNAVQKQVEANLPALRKVVEQKAVGAKRGPKPTGNAKVLVSIRLRPAVLTHYKATGEGWQKRLDDDLARLIGA